MSARFLDEEARAAIAKAIAAIEEASGVEVVVAFRRSSASYLHANLIAGAAVAFVALAAMLFAQAAFSLTAILVDPFLVGGALGALVQLLPQVKRVLTPRASRRRHVERAARATFVERGVHNTRDRSGLLVYISWLEREIALVPDSGLAAVWTSGQAATDLTRAMRQGGAAVAVELAALAKPLATAVPRREDDANELPDEIHEDAS